MIAPGEIWSYSLTHTFTDPRAHTPIQALKERKKERKKEGNIMRRIEMLVEVIIGEYESVTQIAMKQRWPIGNTYVYILYEYRVYKVIRKYICIQPIVSYLFSFCDRHHKNVHLLLHPYV